MNSFLLLLALRRLLNAEIAALPLRRSPAKNDAACRPATIFIGSLPSSQGAPQAEAPFILLQALGGYQDADNFAYVSVALRFCVWNDESEARENDLYNLLAVCGRALLRQRARALEGRYILVQGEQNRFVPWSRPDEQAFQYSEAYILSNWKMLGIE